MFKKTIVLIATFFVGATTLNGVTFRLKKIEQSLEKFEQQVKIINYNIQNKDTDKKDLLNTFRVLDLLQKKEVPRLEKPIKKGLEKYNNKEYHPNRRCFSECLKKFTKLQSALALTIATIENNRYLSETYSQSQNYKRTQNIINRIFKFSITLFFTSWLFIIPAAMAGSFIIINTWVISGIITVILTPYMIIQSFENNYLETNITYE